MSDDLRGSEQPAGRGTAQTLGAWTPHLHSIFQRVHQKQEETRGEDHQGAPRLDGCKTLHDYSPEGLQVLCYGFDQT